MFSCTLLFDGDGPFFNSPVVTLMTRDVSRDGHQYVNASKCLIPTKDDLRLQVGGLVAIYQSLISCLVDLQNNLEVELKSQ